ncbi:MAG: 1,4-alpha-glucan branching enzyme, partial [Gammaproteobacteria bacterium]
MQSNKLTYDLERIAQARHHDPFSVLGKHREQDFDLVRTYLPQANEVTIAEGNVRLERIPDTDIFEWRGAPGTVPDRYHLVWRDAAHHEHIAHDPYSFPPQLPDFDLHLFSEGRHRHAYRILGSHVHAIDEVPGILFAVWAPNAERVSVVGEFNQWDGRRHPMRVRGGSGVWELFIPDLKAGNLYKYEIRNRDSGEILLKSDPYAQAFELRPRTASIIAGPSSYAWNDQAWMEQRPSRDWQHSPMSVYEV